MSRILSIDYGQKRTGVAVSDPQRIIANPLTYLQTFELESFLLDYVKINDVAIVVVGMPLRLDGRSTHATPLVKNFIKRLKKILPDQKIDVCDERFTSKIAMQTLVDSGVTKKKRREKGVIDKLSATIILQSYMQTL